jgi:hypothetical protein
MSRVAVPLAAASLAVGLPLGGAAGSTYAQGVSAADTVGKDSARTPVATKDLESVRVGMTATKVRKLLGPPERISRQVLYQRSVEQWSYTSPEPFLIHFDCTRSQEPIVRSVHSLRPAKP